MSDAPTGAGKKKWRTMLSRPDVDYEGLFGTQVTEKFGIVAALKSSVVVAMKARLTFIRTSPAPSSTGLFLWRIEDFMPVPIPEAEHGNLYEGDCYIALDNHEDPGEWGKNAASRILRKMFTSSGVVFRAL